MDYYLLEQCTTSGGSDSLKVAQGLYPFCYCALPTCPNISPLQDAYSEVASLFAEFFRDLDIVPSDIIAGLVLLRQRQRSKRSSILDQVSLSVKIIIIISYCLCGCVGMCCYENNFSILFSLLRPTMTF